MALAALIGVAACRDERPAAAPVAPAASDPRTATVGPSAADLASSSQPTGAGLITPWLEIKDGRIRTPDGKPFHGRGANLHDTRSCDACSWEPPHIDEVKRRIDMLVDGWHANFVRLLLESYPDDGHAKTGNRRTHFKNVLEDGDYFRDVMQIVGHIGTKKGVYVLVSLWQDPSFTSLGWPSAKTRDVWKKIASALKDMPFVMFGLVNEPQKNEDGKRDHDVWTAMNETVAAIRSVERKDHLHIVTVQGTREWGRSLDHYIEHPITAGGGKNVAYETHVYNRPARFDELVGRPAKKLPVIIGEFGALSNKDVTMLPEDTTELMDLAEKLDVPWLAWSFHTECPPNLLVEHKGTCGVGVSLEPSPWGRMVKDRLARPW
jgi:hypothetical protein